MATFTFDIEDPVIPILNKIDRVIDAVSEAAQAEKLHNYF